MSEIDMLIERIRDTGRWPGTINEVRRDCLRLFPEVANELAIRDADAAEVLSILRDATGRTGEVGIVEMAQTAARCISQLMSQIDACDVAAGENARYTVNVEKDRCRLDRLEELPGISISYNPELVAMPLSLRREIDSFLARLDEGK